MTVRDDGENWVVIRHSHVELGLQVPTMVNNRLLMLFPYSTIFVIQYNSTVYRDHENQGFLALISPRNQLNIYIETFRQHWFNIVKLKNAF